MSNLTKELDSYLRQLFPICRSITGLGNRETLRILQEIIPLTIIEVSSGTSVYDWIIPEEWEIRGGWISTLDGRKIVNFDDCNLHVVSYSQPVNGRFTFEECKSHLHTHPTISNAIPYRTSYYSKNWGFCLTHSQYNELKKIGGPFNIFIDSNFKSGSLAYGELIIPGRSEQEILISTYFCHPSMANDNLSGVLLTAFLARYLQGINDRYYTYRIVFTPETIGAIAYCALNEKALKKIDTGLVISTVGGPGKFGYKQSYDPDHSLNFLIESVFKEENIGFIKYPFDVHGSDERQYSSQGFRINCATICRDRYYEYPEYHTSLDNLQFVKAEQIHETLILYIKLIKKLDNRKIYRNRITHCELMLSNHSLYPSTGGAQCPETGALTELDLILWVLFLCDGREDIDNISRKLNVHPDRLIPIVNLLVEKNVLYQI